jgi:hypothetical protein
MRCGWEPVSPTPRDGDTELTEFFQRTRAESRKGAEQADQLLRHRLGGLSSGSTTSATQTPGADPPGA